MIFHIATGPGDPTFVAKLLITPGNSGGYPKTSEPGAGGSTTDISPTTTSPTEAPTGGATNTMPSTGVVIGIVIPVVTCFVAIAGFGFKIWKWRQHKKAKMGKKWEEGSVTSSIENRFLGR